MIRVLFPPSWRNLPSNLRVSEGRREGQGARQERRPLGSVHRTVPPFGKPCLWAVPPLYRPTRMLRCGYVAGLSGLLTGFPPFITAGSLVLLLAGTAALGTVSPTSCNDGSLYMATSNGLGRK